jgi:glycosyltransferase involved in cell wall biosynthesis
VRVALVNLTRGGLSGGYLKYLRSLVPLLTAHPDIDELDVFAPAAAGERLRKEPWPTTTWPVDDERRGFSRLRRAIRDRNPDVVFVPTARWLKVGDAPLVVMVRNMEPLQAPFGGNPIGESLRNLARRAAARRACRGATKVIAVSNHVLEFLNARWHVPRAKLALVYHGADEPLPPPTRVPSRLRDIQPPIVFTAGSIRPARGLIELIEALPRLKASGLPATVVIGGRVDSGMDAHYRWLAARAAALDVASNIVWAGALDDGEMRWCYEHCQAFVMTSRAEACPNVALEAMRHGCASVSVNRAPMPEFFGRAAVYYRAGDAADLARALGAVVSGTGAAAQLAAAAVERAGAFTWRATAEKTVAELRSAAGS